MTLLFGLSSAFAILLVVLLSAISLVNGGMVKKERGQEQVDGIGVIENTMAVVTNENMSLD